MPILIKVVNPGETRNTAAVIKMKEPKENTMTKRATVMWSFTDGIPKPYKEKVSNQA